MNRRSRLGRPSAALWRCLMLHTVTIGNRSVSSGPAKYTRPGVSAGISRELCRAPHVHSLVFHSQKSFALVMTFLFPAAPGRAIDPASWRRLASALACWRSLQRGSMSAVASAHSSEDAGNSGSSSMCPEPRFPVASGVRARGFAPLPSPLRSPRCVPVRAPRYRCTQ